MLQKVFELPKETLDFFEDPNTCTICFSEKIDARNKAQFACSHKFCRTCVESHLRTHITDGKVSE